jgi:predicted nucleic acid-binding protein
MGNEPVFVDTWAHTALIFQEDQWHDVALALSRQLHAERRLFVTTEWVLTEFLGGVSHARLRLRAAEYVRRLRLSPAVEIHPATHQDWLRAFDYYTARPDKEWSLVDCLSILVCQDRGITEVFSGDHHFQQAGLRILLEAGG